MLVLSNRFRNSVLLLTTIVVFSQFILRAFLNVLYMSLRESFEDEKVEEGKRRGRGLYCQVDTSRLPDPWIASH